MSADQPVSPAPDVQSPRSVRPTRKKSDRYVKLGFLAVLLVAVGWMLARQVYGPIPQGFTRDLPAAMKKAAAEHRNVVVIVETRPPSEDGKRIVEFTLAKPKNVEAFENSKALGVMVSPADPALSPYKINSTPTTLLLAPDGKELARREGYIAETDFPNFLEGKPLQ